MPSSKNSNSATLYSTNNTKTNSYAGGVSAILFNVIVLVYIINLENKLCNCIRDWRHDFIKYYSIILISLSIILMVIGDAKNNIVMQVLRGIIMAGSLVNIWCVYTYIGDLDRTKCACATEKTKVLHYFLYLWRYIAVISIILLIIGVIFMNIKLML
jgi:hypothetical protein